MADNHNQPTPNKKRKLDELNEETITIVRDSFSVAGGIRRTNSFYYLDPAEENNKILIPSIRKGFFIMFHGHRSSGKTTRMFRAIEQLQSEFICLSITFQAGVSFDSKDLFWKSFGSQLKNEFRTKHDILVPEISSSAEFDNVFYDEKLFGGKKVVLFVDEFDSIYFGNDDLISDILSVIRGLKQKSPYTCLQSFIGIGPYSILKLSGQKTSPFTATETIAVRFWTLEEVKSLFKQFNYQLDDKILEDIHDITNGHAGLVCFCGKSIAQTLFRGRTSITLADWIKYRSLELQNDLHYFPPVMRMIGDITKQTEEVGAARELLWTRFLNSTDAIPVLTSQSDITSFLTTIGCLVELSALTFKIPSSITRIILLNTLVPIFQRKIPTAIVPKKQISLTRKALDIVQIVETAFQYFSRERITSAFKVSFKVIHILGYTNEVAPQEVVYHQELYSILRSWLPSSNLIFNQINLAGEGMSNNSRSVSMLILSGTERIVLELIANDTQLNIEEHCTRTAEYGKSLNATSCWVLNFTTFPENDNYKYIQSPIDGVGIIHLWHDVKFEKAKVISYNSDGKQISNDLDLKGDQGEMK